MSIPVNMIVNINLNVSLSDMWNTQSVRDVLNVYMSMP